MGIKISKRISIALLLLIYFSIGWFISGYLPHIWSIDGSTFLDTELPLIPFFMAFYFL